MSFIDRFGRSRPAGSIAVGLLTVALFAAAIRTLSAGKLDYPNYWGGYVFAPFVLVGVGIFVVVLAISIIRGEKPSEKSRGKTPRKIR